MSRAGRICRTYSIDGFNMCGHDSFETMYPCYQDNKKTLRNILNDYWWRSWCPSLEYSMDSDGNVDTFDVIIHTPSGKYTAGRICVITAVE